MPKDFDRLVKDGSIDGEASGDYRHPAVVSPVSEWGAADVLRGFVNSLAIEERLTAKRLELEAPQQSPQSPTEFAN